MERFLIIALAVALTLLSLGAGQGSETAPVDFSELVCPPPSPGTDCSNFPVTSNTTNPQLVDCIERNFRDWPLFPNTTTNMRLGLAVHGRWITSRVNSVACNYLKGLDPSAPFPVDFPRGSIVLKENRGSRPNATVVSPNQSVLGVLTYLYKPPHQFCATPQLEPYDGEEGCLGGEWFYGFDQLKDPTGLNQFVARNANTFCVNCHAPAFEADYLRTLYRQLVPFETNGNGQLKAGFDSYACKVVPLNSTVPHDVPRDPLQLNPPAAQRLFDCWAWQTFIALNWPANPELRGQPDTGASFLGPRSGPTVWETYKPTYEVFQAGNSSWNPSDPRQPFNQRLPAPNGTNCEAGAGELVLTMSSKTRDVVNETGQAFAGTFGDLRDRNGRLVRYEVLFNEVEFDYFLDNTFAKTTNLTPAGPKSAGGKGRRIRVDFPSGSFGGDAPPIEIKSAWKQLCVPDLPPPSPSCAPGYFDAASFAEAKRKFYVRNVLIYEDGRSPSCERRWMALVGLHISAKTYHAPQWIWATFEHKDNVPPFGETGQATFFDPACDGSTERCFVEPFFAADRCCRNVQAPRYLESRKLQPNQMTRLVKIEPEAATLNEEFHNVLSQGIGSPFANYELVSAQWPFNGRTAAGAVNTQRCKDSTNGTNCFTLVPEFLRNTTIESYMSTYRDGATRLEDQVSNRSCMNCHGTVGADFSYIWLDAVAQRVRIKSPAP